MAKKRSKSKAKGRRPQPKSRTAVAEKRAAAGRTEPREASTPAAPAHAGAEQAGGAIERGSRRREEALRSREEARRRRALAVRRARRAQAIRRAVGIAAVAGLVAAAIGYFVWQNMSQGRVQAAADEAAAAVGCTAIQDRPDRGRDHAPPFEYDERPATSGPHSSPLPSTVSVYREPVPEENAVHNLEHGYVMLYYRGEGEAALSEGVITTLEELARQESKVIAAPHPDLEEGNALALAAWNRLQQCPATIEPEQAMTIAEGFISRFRGGGEAPEPSVP